MQSPKTIKTKRLILYVSNINLSHGVHNFVVKNKEFLAQWEPSRDIEFYTLPYQQKELAQDEKRYENGTGIRFWFAKKTKPEVIIGSAAISNIVMGAFCSAFLGYKTDEEQQGNGYMTEALAAVCEFAFCGIGLHRLEASVMPRNAASLAVVKKLGFEEEGLAKSYLRINGVWEDHLHMVRLNAAENNKI